MGQAQLERRKMVQELRQSVQEFRQSVQRRSNRARWTRQPQGFRSSRRVLARRWSQWFDRAIPSDSDSDGLILPFGDEVTLLQWLGESEGRAKRCNNDGRLHFDRSVQKMILV